MEDEKIRLNKYLSECGICSRREADALISGKKVTIDGRIAVMGDKVTGQEKIYADGIQVKKRTEAHTYILLNKPKGIVCTTKNDKNNVIDYLGLKQRVFPVGRLDRDSEGLLMLTSDGDIVNGMMRAGNYHEKEYVVTVDRPVDSCFIKQMSDGVYLEELNVTTRPCKVTKTGKNTFNIILTQGLNRQIRRMCQALGFRVVQLRRIRIMNLQLGNLPEGQWRTLTDGELTQLKKMVEGSSRCGKEKAALNQRTSQTAEGFPNKAAGFSNKTTGFPNKATGFPNKTKRKGYRANEYESDGHKSNKSFGRGRQH